MSGHPTSLFSAILEPPPPGVVERHVPIEPTAKRDAPIRASLVAGVVIAALAGGLHAVGWVFPGVWYAVWLGQVGFVTIATRYSPWRAFWLGLFGGTLGICASFHWGVDALKYSLAAPAAAAWALFLVLCSLEGLSLAIFCHVASILRWRDLRLLVLAPCVWTAIEFWYPRLFPWKIAYSQLEVVPLLQIAELVGSTGIGFVITAAAVIPFFGVVQRRSPHGNERRFARAACAIAAVLVGVTFLYGLARQAQWQRWLAAQPKLKVALVQVDPGSAGADRKLPAATANVASQVDLICWPESALGTYTETLEHFRDAALTLRNSRDSHQFLEPGKGFYRHLLAGSKLYQPGADMRGPYSTAALLISPELEILGRYKKRTLLPFGEYVPFETRFPIIRNYFTLVETIHAGTDPRPLAMTSGHRLGVMVCYEDTLCHTASETVAAGAEVLITLIQGSAFENPLTLKQHLRLAAMRAVENRRYLARCASTGVTCIVDPTGRIVAQLPVHTEDVLVGEVVPIQSQTLYTRLGDFLPWTCTLVVAAAVLFWRRRG